MDMVGVRHRCIPKLGSGAAVAQDAVNVLVVGSNPTSPARAAPVAQRTEQGPSKSEAAGSSPAGRTKPKGRPLNKDLDKSFERTRPWEAEGMSRRTWYRRKRASASLPG